MQGFNRSIFEIYSPGFEEPPHHFVENYTDYVPNWSDLTSRGITLKMLQEVLNWLADVTRVHATLPMNVLSIEGDVQVLSDVDYRIKIHQVLLDIW